MIIILEACLRWGSLVNNISLMSVRVAFWSGYYKAPVCSPLPTRGQLGPLAVPLDGPPDPRRQLRLVHPAPEQSIRNCPELKKKEEKKMVIKDDRPRKSGLPEIKNKVLVFFL